MEGWALLPHQLKLGLLISPKFIMDVRKKKLNQTNQEKKKPEYNMYIMIVGSDLQKITMTIFTGISGFNQ